MKSHKHRRINVCAALHTHTHTNTLTYRHCLYPLPLLFECSPLFFYFPPVLLMPHHVLPPPLFSFLDRTGDAAASETTLMGVFHLFILFNPSLHVSRTGESRLKYRFKTACVFLQSADSPPPPPALWLFLCCDILYMDWCWSFEWSGLNCGEPVRILDVCYVCISW